MKTYRYAMLLAAVFLFTACQKPEPPGQQFSTSDITDAPWGKNFHLTDHHGKPRSLADFKGKAVVLFFGYTHCPDMCPMALYKLSQVMEKLGKDADRVQVLFVTLDPKRDTAEVLAKYTPAFHPTFLGMYADEKATEGIAREFKFYYKHQKPDSNGFYAVDHMGPAYIFDPQGRLRLGVRDEHSVDMIAQDLRVLLKG